MTEAEARLYIAQLRHFYMDLVTYGIVNSLLFLIWLASGAHYFWPFWVLFGWGIGLAFRAFSLGLIPHPDQYTKFLPFLQKDWEEEQLKKFTQTPPSKRKESSE